MRHLILVVVLLSVHWIQAQTNFELGYIINNEEDTIQGEIKFNWVTRPGELTFRASGLTDKKLNTTDIKGFKLDDGDYFEGLTVEVDVSPTNPDELLEMGKDQFESQSFFAKALLLGSANLYQSFDQERRRYHYFLGGVRTSDPVELISGKRAIPADQVSKLPNASGAYIELDKYKGQLAYLLGDCQDVQRGIQVMSRLTENAIKSIIEKYNNCNENIVSYRQSSSIKKLKLNLGIMAGAQLLQVKHESRGEKISSPVHNLGLKLILNINERKNLNLALTAFHRHYNVRKESTKESLWRLTPTSDISRTTTTTDIENHNWQQLTFILETKYTIGIGSNKFFMNAGPGISFAYDGTSTKTSNSFSVSSPSNETSENSIFSDRTTSDRDRQLFLNFGVGYQWKRFMGSIDYELGASMIKLNTEKTRAISFRLTYLIL